MQRGVRRVLIAEKLHSSTLHVHYNVPAAPKSILHASREKASHLCSCWCIIPAPVLGVVVVSSQYQSCFQQPPVLPCLLHCALEALHVWIVQVEHVLQLYKCALLQPSTVVGASLKLLP